MSALRYRPDIDGLRAVAVLPVVLFHLEAHWMPGGYVGVDVFFVISGFLITSIIQREIEAGTFTLTGFYERRIRRILPALLAVIAVTLAGSVAILMPRELYDVAQSVVAAILFASNVLFFYEAGYFDAAAHAKPLLHTWTLAVEEQFYIGVPIILMLLARWARRPALWIGALTAASLALSVTTTHLLPTAAFYLIPWRAWELGIGALLALGLGPRLERRWMREAAGAGGIALIAGAVLLFDETTPFPGTAALAPTLGAALVIQAGRFGPSLAGRLLSTAGPVWIGKLSYSLYLWHWPVIVFYIYWAMELPGPVSGAVLFALALALAWLSWRFVERPFRRPSPGRASRRAPFVAAGAGMAGLCAAASAVLFFDGLPARLPPETRAMAAFTDDVDPRYNECFRDKVEAEMWLLPCTYGEPSAGPVRVALWGDSHAPSLAPALDRAGRVTGVRVALYAHHGCPGLTGIQVYWTGREHDCSAFLDDTYRAIAADPEIELVILAKRAPVYAKGWVPYGLVEQDNLPLRIGPRDGPLPGEADRMQFFLDSLERTVVGLKEAGKQVALVYPLPEAGMEVPSKLVRYMLRGEPAANLVLPRDQFDARSAELIEAYDRLVERHDLVAVRLHERLCDATACRLVLDGAPIFRDETHLNATTARGLAPLFVPALNFARGAS